MIALGYCQCGCGGLTTIAWRNDPRIGQVRGQPARFLRGHLRGALNARWNGGRRITNGYVMILQPEHPRAKGGYVQEHVLIAERALGKPLAAKHPVHHVDEDTQNNGNTNLVVCEDNAYHMLLHRRQRALDATGNANALTCVFCGAYDIPEALVLQYRGSRATPRSFHRECEREDNRRRWPGKRQRKAARSHRTNITPTET